MTFTHLRIITFKKEKKKTPDEYPDYPADELDDGHEDDGHDDDVNEDSDHDDDGYDGDTMQV